mgnify:CR=1 FL=1
MYFTLHLCIAAVAFENDKRLTLRITYTTVYRRTKNDTILKRESVEKQWKTHLSDGRYLTERTVTWDDGQQEKKDQTGSTHHDARRTTDERNIPNKGQGGCKKFGDADVTSRSLSQYISTLRESTAWKHVA